MKKLLQELKTFKLYGKQCLDKSLYKEYKEYLCEKIKDAEVEDSTS